MLTEEEKNAGLEGRIIPVNIEQQMKSAYIDYSMSVIVSRALPDARDGLKPVHRRILYDMSAELGLYSDKPTRKSARIVGDVLGKFHPHGDLSVYDAMVRMAQEWSLRYPLIFGQGNFGSMDGDSPAAMRYTEARMRKITDEVMADIDKETIDWTNNFDDTMKEPTVLPTKIPLLLVNGASGIAVGMATNMAPHNLGEVIDACCAYVDNHDIECEELLQYVKGPDFPTGGIIYGYEGVREALMTGRGRVVMRARTEIEHTASGRECIVVTEIPYMVNKAEMIKKIADMINDKKIEGISYINDESDRQGLRIVIILKQDAVASVVLNTLYKNTPLQTSFPVNNIALVHGRPYLLNLRDMIRHFIEHRHDVVVRRTRFDLQKAEERLHIVLGLLIAQDNIDEVIHTIRAARTPDEAKTALMEKFGLSELQASAIIEMRLRALTGLEHGKLTAERDELQKQIAYFKRHKVDFIVLVTPDTPRYRAMFDAGESGNALLGEPLIFREGGSGTQLAGQKFFTENGIDSGALNIVARIDNSEAVLRAVACGLGCAVVSGLAAGATKELLSFPLVGKNNEREIYMIRSRDRRPTKSARAFIDFLLDRRTLH